MQTVDRLSRSSWPGTTTERDPLPKTKPASRKPSSAAILLGSLALAVAVVTSGLMSAKHIWALTLPGCAQGGGCDWATNGPWSSFLGLPVAYAGLGFFTALLLVWLTSSRSGVWKPLITISRLGVAGSLAFLGIMIATGHFCPWCLTIHLANFFWWGTLELTSRRTPWSSLPIPIGLILGVAAFSIMAGAAKLMEWHVESVAADQARKDADQSISQIGEPKSPIPEEPKPKESISTPIAVTPETPTASRFGGRFWTGSPDAAVRIVIFQDYECKLCREAESTLAGLLASRSDVSLSVRHWPFDKDCNKMILGESMHPGACVDARAAEAVGLSGGNDAFWKLHNWLFARRGDVKIADIRKQVAQMGIDSARFESAYNGSVVDSFIASDIADAVTLGIKFTPMLFVNGYEVRGWQSAGAIPAAIDRAAQMARQQPRKNDRPDPAIEQQFKDWQDAPPVPIALAAEDHIRGSLSAPTAVLMYGDITEPFNAEAARMLDRLIADTQRVVLIFRSFPLQAECNDMVKRPINPRACEAAKILEAAGIAGGESAFWKARFWFTKNVDHLPPSLVEPIAAATGLSNSALSAALANPRVSVRISANIETAKQLGVDTSPTLYVNGRRLRDWRAPGLLERVFAATSSPVQVYKRPGQ
jgi:protein-disulfide isomerase/uncharacterized membrane protein